MDETLALFETAFFALTFNEISRIIPPNISRQTHDSESHAVWSSKKQMKSRVRENASRTIGETNTGRAQSEKQTPE
jgi:hypothetical protein